MKRTTLAMIVLATAHAAASVAAAQTPVPPARPTRPAAPTPGAPAAPVARPAAPMDGGFAPLAADWGDEMRWARERALEDRQAALADARDNAQRARDEARIVAERLPGFGFAPMAPMEAMAPMAPMAPMRAMAAMDAMSAVGGFAEGFGGERFERRGPPQSWAPSDPGDSLYRVAREVLNRGDWGRAARMFADLQKNYPKSAFQSEAQYWEAWARYKIGTTDELRSAAKILEPLAARITPSPASGTAAQRARTFYVSDGRRTADSDILALYARINGALAQRGDRAAAEKVEQAAKMQGAPCDREDIQVRTEALSALSQMDPSQALPILRRVLDRKDDCSAELRRNAVFILGRRSDNDAQGILIGVAKNDPNIAVRVEAINNLSRAPGDAAVNALEELLRGESDERIQRAAVRGLMMSDSPRARAGMRTLIERKESPLNLRLAAIESFVSDRTTSDDASYLRGLFARADNDQMKSAIVSAVSRLGGADNDQWLIGIARNTGESSSVRSAALSRLSRSPTISTADLAKLYDGSSESAEIRNRIISMLGARKDQESTDKLIDIVRTSTVVENRTRAIVALRDKKDPRATQALMDILDGKKP